MTPIASVRLSVVNSVNLGFGFVTPGMYSQVDAIVVEFHSKPNVYDPSFL